MIEQQKVSPETARAMETSSGQLTSAGWPRPRVGGWPIPWISPSDELSQTNGARMAAAGTGGVSAVCGEGYQEAEKALLLVNPPTDVDRLMPGDIVSPTPDGGNLTSIDNGVLHIRCARLALAWCPKLRELMEDDDLVCIEVVAHDCEPQFLELTGERILTATFPQGVVVELPL